MTQPLDPISVEQRHIDFVEEHTPRFMQHLGSQIAHILARFERDLPRAHQPRSGEMREAVALEGYRAAVQWIATDSWDGCSDCIDILRIARSVDDFDWSPNDHAAALERLRHRAGSTALISPTVTVPQDAEGEVERMFVLEWISAPRPPVHPAEMTGRQVFRSIEDAGAFLSARPADARFKSLTEIATTKIDRSAALTPAKGGA